MKSNDSTNIGSGKTLQRQRQARTRLARWLILAILSSLIIWSSPPIPVEANAGDLDPTFGTGGKVTTNFGIEDESIAGIAIQADGKIVTAGTADFGGQTWDFLLVRYNTDGSLDSSFGSGGKVRTGFANPGPDVAYAIAIQSDGKIVAAGWSVSRSNGILARYDSNGALDLSFGSGGKVSCPLPELGNIIIQPDGKIVVSGSNFGLARLNADGSFDSSFGAGGIVSGISLVSTAGGDAVPSSWRGGLAIQADGKIVESGLADLPGTCSALSALVRYNSDGTPDSSFGSGGWVFTSFGPSSTANDVRIQSDGKILAAGVTTPNCANVTQTDFALARYNPDGSLDSSFGNGGKVTTDLSPVDDESALVIQPNGKIMVVGMAFVGSDSSFRGGEFAVIRYHPDGTLDSTFGSNGSVHTAFQDWVDCRAAALQSDGKLVVAGFVRTDPDGTHILALARYQGEYDLCLQDDTNGNLLRFNSLTGEYQFIVCPVGDSIGVTLSGKATITGGGCGLRLQDNSSRFRRLGATVQTCNGTGSAVMTLQGLAGDIRTIRISDSDIHNNTCSCF